MSPPFPWPDGLKQLILPRPAVQVATDVVDILVVAYLIYRVLLVLRGTRAMQMGFGLLVLGGLYVVGRWAGLVTTVTLLSSLLSSILLVVVVVFQSDLRRGLMRAGARPSFFGLAKDDEAKMIEEVISAAGELARLRHGAIMTFERDANLDEFIVGSGTVLDAQISRELLVSIFIPVGENKLHDGAVIIRGFRIAQAGVFFPMPEKHGLDKKFGSRHRAAIGITADTDAVAIVVSEERGTIMFCFQENHVDNCTPDTLRSLLRGYQKKRKKVGPASSRRPSLEPPPSSPRPVEKLVAMPIKTGPVSQPASARRPSLPPPSVGTPPPPEAIPEEGVDQ